MISYDRHDFKLPTVFCIIGTHALYSNNIKIIKKINLFEVQNGSSPYGDDVIKKYMQILLDEFFGLFVILFLFFI